MRYSRRYDTASILYLQAGSVNVCTRQHVAADVNKCMPGSPGHMHKEFRETRA